MLGFLFFKLVGLLFVLEIVLDNLIMVMENFLNEVRQIPVLFRMCQRRFWIWFNE